MTRTTSARVTGVTFLAYIAVGVGQMLVGRGVSAGDGTAARLASIAGHASQVRVNALLGLSTCIMAFVLAATLYGITRVESEELALLASACRIAEGLLGALPILASMGLLWLATTQQPAAGQSSDLIAGLLWRVKSLLLPLGASFFAIGSTIFSVLLLRGRMIPALLGWLGVVASALLVVVLPLQLVGWLGSPITDMAWIPMALFEVPLGIWLIVKGVPDHASDLRTTTRPSDNH